MNKNITWIFVLILLTSFVTAYTYNEDFNSYYEVNYSNMNFTNALNSCENMGTGWSLVRIDTVEENTYINTLRSTDLWLGATDTEIEGTWKWLDNRVFYNNNATVTYSNWEGGEPSGDDYLGMVGVSGLWEDTIGNDNREFICENHLDEFYINSSNAIYYLNDSIYNNTDSIKDSFSGYDGTGYGKTFYNGVNNGATYNNNLTGAITGATWNTSCTLEDGSVGNCLEFDGDGDIVTIPNSFKINNNLVVSGWVKPINLSKLRQTVVSNVDGGFSNGWALFFDDTVISTHQSKFSIEDVDGNHYDAKFTYLYNENEWYMVTGVFNGSKIKLYINGVLVDSENVATWEGTTTTADTYIGRYNPNSDLDFQGNIKDVIILDTALNSTEVLNLYNTNKVDTEDYYHEINFALNEGTGTTVDGNTGKFGGYYEFNTTNEILLNEGIGDLEEFTVCAWNIIKGNNSQGGSRMGFIGDSPTSDNYLGYNWNERSFLYEMKDGSGGSFGTGSWVFNEWFYTCYVYDKTYMNFWKNGVYVTRHANSNKNISLKRIGSGYGGSGDWFNGSIDEVKIYNRALTQTEIQQEMNSNALNHSNGIVAYYPFNDDIGTDVYDQNQLSTGYQQSIYNTDSSIFKWDKSINFDGVDDYIDFGDIDLDESSVCSWFKLPEDLNDMTNIDYNIVDKDGQFSFRLDDTTRKLQLIVWDATTTPNVRSVKDTWLGNTWYHVCFTTNGTDINLYIDGSFDNSNTYTAPLDASSNTLKIAINNGLNRPFNGSIQDVRIYDKALSENEINWLYHDFQYQTLINFSDYLVGDTLQVSNNDYAYNYTITNPLLIQTTIDLYNISIYRNNTLIYIQELNVTNNSELNLSAIGMNYVYFYDENTGLPLNNYDVEVLYPNTDLLNLTTNAEGYVNFTSYRDLEIQTGDYEITFNDATGFETPITFTETKTLGQLPFNVSHDISRTTINVYIYYRTNGTVFNKLSNIVLEGIGNGSTSTGYANFTNISITDGSYILRVFSEGYFTELKTLTYDSQNSINISFYLLETNETSSSTITAEVRDSAQRLVQDSVVNLLEYKEDSLSYVSVSQCYTDSNGECKFIVQVDEKTYKLTASKIIDGVLLTASSGEEGIIFKEDLAGGTPITFNEETVILILSSVETYIYNPLYYLKYNINEDFNNVTNVSTITTNFYTTDGSDATICLEFFQLNSGSSKTSLIKYCVTGSSGQVTPLVPFVLNRSNSYEAKVYAKYGTYNETLQTFTYLKDGNLEELLEDNSILEPVIIFSWIVIISICLYLGNIPLLGVLVIILSIVEPFLFKNWMITQGMVLKIIIGAILIWAGKKKEDF